MGETVQEDTQHVIIKFATHSMRTRADRQVDAHLNEGLVAGVGGEWEARLPGEHRQPLQE